MKTADLYGLTISILKRLDKEHPGRTFRNKAGEKATIQDIIDCLSKMKGWLYPGLYPSSIVKVTRCKDCAHYKKYKRKTGAKGDTFYACSKTKVQHPPTYYCADGEDRV